MILKFKKSQLKSMLLLALFTILFTICVYGMTVVLNAPATVTWWTSSSSVDHNFTVTTNASETIDWCSVQSNRSGTWTTLANYTSGIVNDTPFVRGITWTDTNDTGKMWNVTCYNGSSKAESTIFDLGVDANPPTIALDSPSDNFYTNDNATVVKYTPTDSSNPETCLFYINLSNQVWAINQTNLSYVSNAQILVSLDNISANNSHNIAEGSFIWNAVCNDSAGSSVWAEATNRTFTIDKTIPTDIRITEPTNDTVSSNSTPLVRWNQTTESHFDEYTVYISTNFTDFFGEIVQTKTISTRTTNSTILSTLPVNDQYYILVEAKDLADNKKNTSEIFWYAVDTTDPSITVNYPSVNNTYQSNSTINLSVTVTDDNPDSCDLLLSNYTGNQSGHGLTINVTEYTIVSGTAFNLTASGAPDGVYRFNVECNDSDNNRVNVTATDWFITVDTLAPTGSNITSTWHGKNSTDGTPVLTWGETIEINFDRYFVEARYTINGSVDYAINVTNKSTPFVELNLTIGNPRDKGNHTYNFSVKVYDSADNNIISANTTDTHYYVDGICARLQAGWNLCGIVATNTSIRNLSVIGAEAGADYVSIWNNTNEWATCNIAVGTSNCENTVGIVNGTHGIEHVWLYMDSAGLWENRTWSAIRTTANTTLRNVSTNGWNIFGQYVRNGLTFDNMNQSTRFGNINVSMYSKPFNNGTANIPYVTRHGFNSINKDQRLEYGEAMWIFFNGTANGSGIRKFSNKTWDTNGW